MYLEERLALLTQRVESLESRLNQHMPHALDRTMADVQEEVATSYCITLREMIHGGRSQCFVLPRQLAMWICHRVRGYTVQAVGRAFNRDHTTVVFACNSIESRALTDRKFAAELEKWRLKYTKGTQHEENQTQIQ